jgi:hypothetical protein
MGGTNMKRTLLSVLLCSALVLTSVAGCSSSDDKDESEKTAEDTQAQEETVTSEGITLIYNGEEVKTGIPFADIADGLGDELRPAEDIPPCDGEGDTMTLHWYDGLEIGSNESGIIDYYNLTDGGEVASQAQTDLGLHLQDTIEQAKTLYGTPTNESEYVVNFDSGANSLTCGISEEGTVSYIYVTSLD